MNVLVQIVAFGTLLAVSATSVADTVGFKSALMAGEAGVAVRARYELVDQDGIADDANALTARLRLNYKTGAWNNLSAYVEFDHVFHLLDNFNSGAGTSPGKTQYPVIVDPDGADLNQFYLDYEFDDNWRARIGRQRILLDNQRFVGGVGWRQNEQTYDGLTLNSNALRDADFSYNYIANVRRIFGGGVAAGRNNVDAHLLHAKFALSERWSVTPYFYYIDNDDVAVFSTATLGASTEGRIKAGDGSIRLYAEFATQDDAGNNPVSYDASYLRLGGAWFVNERLSLGVDFESLGGNTAAGSAFRTPLATLHAFQGWADKFLATPDGGVDDLFATVKFKAGGWNLAAVYHDFSAETGSLDYGTELDVSAGTTIRKDYSILFKGAFFSSDVTSMTDTTKIWVMLTTNFAL